MDDSPSSRHGGDTTAGKGCPPGTSPFRVSPGHAAPLGVQDCLDGFNFAIFSRHAERVELLLFEDMRSTSPMFRIDLGLAGHRTGDVWHALVDGVHWGQPYAYRVYGPWSPEEGHRFDSRRLLVDPSALAITPVIQPLPEPHDGDQDTVSPNAPAGPAVVGDMRSLVVERHFDWQRIPRPRTPWPRTVIYETHVRGLTMHPSAAVAHPGTFLGVIEKIPHFRQLGVTAVELMPVQAFDAWCERRRGPPADGGFRNYWGYDTIAFFAPHGPYATRQGGGDEVKEFKTMVRELHRAGIEVILDMVFNHTAEGGEDGPTFCFRGFDNAIWYMLDEQGRYLNFSGCGNTLNCNHPVVRDFIVDCLRYWVREMHVDGFRFDLASILGRDEDGNLVQNAPLLERIAQDPILRSVKLIAEAWDLGGAYQVGSFPGQRWAEWNGRFRDDVRRFWRGDPGMTGAFASRLCGSADLYQRSGKEPVNSINFVTCHDGFTLNDVVSYNARHNGSNGVGNCDGDDENYSTNYGTEGPTADPVTERCRIRHIKNLLATLFLSRGVPMLLGGDEFRRTQGGNNNAWCQDNAISWYDWRLLETNSEIFRFVREMIALRRRYPVLGRDAFYTENDITWFGPGNQAPDWDGPTRALACLIRQAEAANASASDRSLCLLFNASESPVEFCLPPGDDEWRVAVDTGAEPPNDVFAAADEPLLSDRRRFALRALSLAVLSHCALI